MDKAVFGGQHLAVFDFNQSFIVTWDGENIGLNGAGADVFEQGGGRAVDGRFRHKSGVLRLLQEFWLRWERRQPTSLAEKRPHLRAGGKDRRLLGTSRCR